MSFREMRRPRSPRRGEDRSREDAERLFFDLEAPRRNWKSLSLCKQVAQAASHVLSEECQDPCLNGACVVEVEQLPDGGRLVVSVVLAPGRNVEDVLRAHQALTSMSPLFRSAAASWIRRKRVPELAFRVLVWGNDAAR